MIYILISDFWKVGIGVHPDGHHFFNVQEILQDTARKVLFPRKRSHFTMHQAPQIASGLGTTLPDLSGGLGGERLD